MHLVEALAASATRRAVCPYWSEKRRMAHPAMAKFIVTEFHRYNRSQLGYVIWADTQRYAHELGRADGHKMQGRLDWEPIEELHNIWKPMDVRECLEILTTKAPSKTPRRESAPSANAKPVPWV